MHIEENILEFDFEGRDPINIDLRLQKNPELITPFIAYMQGLEKGSEEYNKHKNYWIQGGWMKAGYIKALHDIEDYWNKYKGVIKLFRLSGYDGVSFLLKKLIENWRGLFYLGDDTEIEIKKEEIEEFRNKKRRKS